ncbi:MAG: hypothetical protein KKD24_06480 [Proteobacteria bacterium]|nr:hypothetical protein [Pseudomonadota bacterium]
MTEGEIFIILTTAGVPVSFMEQACSCRSQSSVEEADHESRRIQRQCPRKGEHGLATEEAPRLIFCQGSGTLYPFPCLQTGVFGKTEGDDGDVQQRRTEKDKAFPAC